MRKIFIFIILFCCLFLLVGCNTGDRKVKTTEQFLEALETDKNIILKNDLDFSGIEWTKKRFNGRIEGNGYTIKNISMVEHEATFNIGLFSSAKSIKNVNFENIKIKYYGEGEGVGGLIGLMNGTHGIEIENVKISGSIYAPNATYVGGLVGYIDSNVSIKILNSEVNMTITALDGVGGAVGAVGVGSGYFEGVTNKGEIKALDSAAGGILGAAYKEVSFVNCKNEAPISALCRVGGIIGSGHISQIKGCVNGGSITSKISEDKEALAGGIGGEIKLYDTVSDCTNEGDIIGNADYVGGLVGRLSGEGKVVGSTNTEKVNGADKVGGIAGKVSEKIQFLNCENDSEINGVKCVGGIIGAGYDNVFVSKCSNNTDISAYDYVGGIIGYIDPDYDGTVSYNKNKGNVTATIHAAGILGVRAGFAKIQDLGTNENFGKIQGEEVDEIFNW